MLIGVARVCCPTMPWSQPREAWDVAAVARSMATEESAEQLLSTTQGLRGQRPRGFVHRQDIMVSDACAECFDECEPACEGSDDALLASWNL